MSSNFFDNPAYLQYERGACYALAGLYGLVLLVSTAQLWLTVAREQKGVAWFTSQKVTLLFILLTVLGRALFFGAIPDLWRPSVKLFDVLWTQPALFLFSAYTLLIYHWASVHFQSVDGDSERRVTRSLHICFAVNALTYLFQATLYILLYFVDDVDETFASVEPIVLAVIFLATSLFVAYFGCSITCRSTEISQTAHMVRTQRRAAFVMGVLTLSFSTRALVNPFWHNFVAHFGGPAFFAFLGVFYLFVEIAPLTAVLLFAARVPRRTSTTSGADSDAAAGIYFNVQDNAYDVNDAVYDDEDGFFRDAPLASTSIGGDSYLAGDTTDLVRSADRLKTSLKLADGFPSSYTSTSASFQRDARLLGQMPRIYSEPQLSQLEERQLRYQLQQQQQQLSQLVQPQQPPMQPQIEQPGSEDDPFFGQLDARGSSTSPAVAAVAARGTIVDPGTPADDEPMLSLVTRSLPTASNLPGPNRSVRPLL